MKLITLPIWLYQKIISPMIGSNCRFTPTCSEYATEALETHGTIKGSWLTVKRLCKCHPFGSHGYDPVPPKNNATGAAQHDPLCGTDRPDHPHPH